MTNEKVEYREYPHRYLIAVAVGLGNFVSAAIGSSYSSIGSTTALYYNVDQFEVN